jgi:hypothetical protein
MYCAEHPDAVPPSLDEELAVVRGFQAELAPWGGAWAVAGCRGMPLPPAGDVLGDVQVARTPPILVIGTTGDPATPYAGALAMVDRIPGSGLLSFDSTEHTGYGSGRSACVDDLTDAYLVGLGLPPAGTHCPPG